MSIAGEVERRAAELLGGDDWRQVEDDFVVRCLNHQEVGDATLYAALHKDRFLFNTTPTNGGEWFKWGKHVWELDHTRRRMAAVEECALTYEAMRMQLDEDIEAEGLKKQRGESVPWKINRREKLTSRIDKLRTGNGMDKVLNLVPVVCPEMSCQESDFDQQPWLLPCANGVIDLKTGALINGRPEDKLTRVIDVAYDPQAEYEKWHNFVVEVCGGEDVAGFVKRSLGFAITGRSDEQYLWVFTGPARNGKGTLFGTVGEVLGKHYYHEISSGVLLEQRNEPSPAATSEHLYSLMAKRLVVGAETNKGKKIDAALVKRLTGQDMVTCRPNFRSEVSFKPTHTLMLHTNHLPFGLATDTALLHRLLIVHFPFIYVDNPDHWKRKEPPNADRFRKRNKFLKDELAAIKPGILRWLVEGCLEWQQIGIAPPPSIIAAVDKLAAEQDYIGQFVADCLTYWGPDSPDTRISCGTVHDALRWWWVQNMDASEQKVPQLKTVTATLRDRGYAVEKKGGKFWVYGVSLNYDIAEEVERFAASGGNRGSR